MILLVTKAHPTIRLLAELHPGAVGRLVVPKDSSGVGATAALGIEWGADNAAFSGFDPDAFVRMLDRLEHVPGGRFVVAADVVGDAAATLERFWEWRDVIYRRGLPVALALQNGATVENVPWGGFDAVFVGGDDAYKMGPDARAIVDEARRRGLWAHMGRVNTAQRIRYAKAIGCDSADGSQWSRWTDRWLAWGVDHAQAPVQSMLEVEA